MLALLGAVNDTPTAGSTISAAPIIRGSSLA
jgi:hypothetical protein